MTDNTPTLDQQQLAVELIFKPLPPGQHLREEERALLSAFIGGILKEIEQEERENPPCK